MKSACSITAALSWLLLASCGQPEEGSNNAVAAPTLQPDPAEMLAEPLSAPETTLEDLPPIDPEPASEEELAETIEADQQLILGAVTDAIGELVGSEGIVQLGDSEISSKIIQMNGANGLDLAQLQKVIGEEQTQALQEKLQQLQEGDFENLKNLGGSIGDVKIMVAGEDGIAKELPLDPETGGRIELHQILGDQEGLKEEFKSILGTAIEEAKKTQSNLPTPTEDAP